LLGYEMWIERAKFRQCATMNYYYVGRWLKKNAPQIKAIIFPFENQPWEKALRLGIKRYCPSIKVIAYRPFAPLHLSFFPSQLDVAHDQIPDRLVVLGSHWREIFVRHGFPSERLIIGPALRFAHLLETHQDTDYQTQPDDIKRSVLIPMPIGQEDSLELLYKLLQAFETRPDLRVLIKFHPKMSNPDALIALILNKLHRHTLPEHFQIVTRRISELLSDTSVLIFNSTAVSYEAIVLGIPALFIQSDIWLDLNKLAWNPIITVSARSPTQIAFAVDSFLKSGEPDLQKRLEMGHEVLARTFTPTTIESVQVFFDL
jgi:surface carbohydrate biosynthesis protein (TIGR04326 family)